MKPTEHEYRPINAELLDKSHLGDFELFYKTESFGETRFVKFASSEPAHLEKLRGLIESGELQEQLYIKETDRMKYHGQATESLRALVNDPKVKLEVKVAKVYEVSKEIMKEFFEGGAPPNILRYSDQAIEQMENCLVQNKELGFFLIAKIASRDYYTYTHSINVGMYCMVFGLLNINSTTQRTKDFRKETEKVGIKVKDIYWTMGHYDVVIIAEAPDDETMSAMALALGRLGNVTTQTLRAFPIEEMENIIGKLP